MASPEREEQTPDEPDVVLQAMPYIVPYAVFSLFTTAASYLTGWQTALYAAKVAAVGACVWYYRRQYKELRPRLTPALLPAVLTGLAVIVVWIGLDPYYPQSGAEWQAFLQGVRFFEHPEKVQAGFDPFSQPQLMPAGVAMAFRFLGAVLLVPVFEELAFRSWLMRQFVRYDFRSVPLGAFTWLSFVATVLVFGLTHREWLAAIVCGMAFNGLMYWRKDLFLCMVAHAVANLALGVWVVTQGAWGLW